MADRTDPPFIVFGAPRVEEDSIREVVDSLRSGWIGTGPKVARFEAAICDYTGSAHAVALNSCTAALHLSLMAAGVGPGDEVVTTAMTFCATAHAIVHAGARPVLVDCDRDTQLMDLDRVEEAIGPRTRAVIPVHLYGQVLDMDRLSDLARSREIRVIEDASHALEGRLGERRVGSLGDFGCFSFYATKSLTTGEGGVVSTDDPRAAERMRSYRIHGLSRDAWRRVEGDEPIHAEAVVPGFKYNMTDLQAALGLPQFAQLEARLARREAIWKRYDQAFAALPALLPPGAAPGTRHGRHLYTLLIDPERCGIGRDAFVRALHRLGIGTGIHYVGVHLQPWFRKRYDASPADHPHATWVSERTVSLPLTAAMSDAEVDRVIQAVSRVLTGPSDG